MSNVNNDELRRLIETSIIPIKRVMNITEVAEFASVSESLIYKLTAAKKIPFSRPFGRAMYFDRFEIEEWLLSFRIQTEKDTQREANSQILKRRRA
jgi:excisionase family DNA binding protein